MHLKRLEVNKFHSALCVEDYILQIDTNSFAYNNCLVQVGSVVSGRAGDYSGLSDGSNKAHQASFSETRNWRFLHCSAMKGQGHKTLLHPSLLSGHQNV